MTKNQILGLIGVLWGGAATVSNIMQGGPQGTGNYFVGQIIGMLFSIVMFLAGIYYLFGFDEGRTAPAKKRKRKSGSKTKKKRRRPPVDPL